MQSLSAAAIRTSGIRASRISTGTASSTFCAKLGLELLGSRVPKLFTSPRVALINSVRAATNASRARSITRSCRTSLLRCRIGCNDCGSTRPNRPNLLASIRSFLRLRRFDPSINRGLATSTSCPQPQMTSCTQGECVPTSKTTRAASVPERIRQCAAASYATVPPPAFPPPDPECSSGSIGRPDLRPPSDGRDWREAHRSEAFLRRWLRSPFSDPAFPSAFPPVPPALPSYPAAPGPATSPASMAVHSSFQNCYASSRSISLAVVIAPSSALITGSLTPSVIGDRPSHPIYGLVYNS